MKRIGRGTCVHWPLLTETFTSDCQGQWLKQPASIMHALCRIFNSQVKSINSYPLDWLKLINRAMQDTNGHWGRPETPCQTLQSKVKSMANLCCLELDNRTVTIVHCQDTPLYCLFKNSASAGAVKAAHELFFHKACLAALDNFICYYYA